MNPVDPAELSAYLDGELTPKRAQEVAAAIADDSSLRAAYEALVKVDAAWRGVAGAARFQPAVRLPYGRSFPNPVPRAIAVVAALVALRMVPELTDSLSWGFAVHGIALAMIVAWLCRSGIAPENIP